LLQRQIQFNELTEVVPIAEGGFGVIHRAKHDEWGTVVYKELKCSIIADGSRFENHCFLVHAKVNYPHICSYNISDELLNTWRLMCVLFYTSSSIQIIHIVGGS